MKYASIVLMPNIFQLHISRPIVGFILGATVLLFLLLSFASNLFNGNPIGNYLYKNNYQDDVDLLFHYAQKLGYTTENKLNFFRIKPNFESNEDVTTLVFSTTDSVEIFSGRIDALGLSPDNAIPNIYGKPFVDDTFGNSINAPYSNTLVVADSTTEYRSMPISRTIAPVATEWYLLVSQQPNREIKLHIFFAQLPNENLFLKDKENGKIVTEPIVVMSLKR